MYYVKISFVNGFTTLLESDTLWAYLMYYLNELGYKSEFNKLKEWLENWKICFSSAFPVNWKIYFPKPLIKVENREKKNETGEFNLHWAILSSFRDYSWKKKIRKAEYFSQGFLRRFFDNNFSSVKDEDILNISNYTWFKIQNNIPRWNYVENKEETNVYPVEDIIFWPEWVFFVKSEEDISDLLEKFKEIFLIFGWWKAKSRGLGVVRKVEFWLVEDEDLKEILNLLNLLSKNNVVLSNVYVKDKDKNKIERIKVWLKLPTRISKDEKFLDKPIVYVKPGSILDGEGDIKKLENKILSGKNFSKC